MPATAVVLSSPGWNMCSPDAWHRSSSTTCRPPRVLTFSGMCVLCVACILQATLEKGTSFGAPSVHENTLAKKVIEAVPSVEMVRFTNSGTEVLT